jgi:serine protease AprX
MIAAGAVAMAHLDNGPASATEAVAVDDLSLGSMYRVVDQIGARSLWDQGFTGTGVNVAVIDTGVAAVESLTAPGKLAAVVDLSSEQSDPSTAHVDSFGHGTHIAGIIAGRQPGSDPAQSADHPEWFMGVAPDAGIVSVKVAGRDGEVSLASLVTGIDWVVAHADELDIRVLNLAFNGNVGESYLTDPIAAAVERAWNAGIVVVTAAGNSGADAGGLATPATDPYVIAVGGLEITDAGAVTPTWASSGDGVRNPDLTAPGAHIESLRAPGSYADLEHPEGYVDVDRFLASGSSQSAAVTAGAVALLLDARPDLAPDEVKQLLTASAAPVAGGDSAIVGAGGLDIAAASQIDPVDAAQTWAPARADLPSPTAPGVMAVQLDPSSSSWMSSSWMSSSWMSSSWMSSSWMSSSWMSSSWM